MSTSPVSECLAPAPAISLFAADQLYTLAQAVERTQISRSALYESMRHGDLPFLKVGETRRLLGADLNRFLARFYHASAC